METFETMVSYEKELLNFKSELANLSNEVKKQGSAIEKKAWNGPKLTKSKPTNTLIFIKNINVTTP